MFRFFTAILTVFALGLCGSTAASAQTATNPPSTTQPSPNATSVAPTTTSPPGPVSIGAGFEFSGGTVTPPDGSAPRALSPYQAAAFVQACCAAFFLANPGGVGPPPVGTPVYRIDVNGTWGELSGYMTIYYANDGNSPYVSFPTDVNPTPTPNPTPPPPKIWFQPAADQTVAAFNGTATLVQTAGVADPRRFDAGQRGDRHRGRARRRPGGGSAGSFS